MKFDRVVCINLERRVDRFDEFTAQIPPVWPFGQIDRVNAVDGARALPPAWWNSGNGAWGCYRSHVNVIEDCLNDQTESVLIFEDDALLDRNFVAKAVDFFAQLPDDWNWAYLGGQHWNVERQQPVQVNDAVFCGRNIHRTHAYALRGREILLRLYKHLTRADWPTEERDSHHIDKQYGQLMSTEGLPVYCPPAFIVGQRESASNIGNRSGEQWWNNWTLTRSDSPLVAVLGAFRGGTSCTAGVLHHLGVHMGKRFAPPTAANPKGFFEASQLKQLCIRSYKEPWMRERNSREQRVTGLRMWGNARRDECREGQLAGGKHPTLCLMIPELLEAWGDVRFVVVDRPVQESIDSLRKRGWGWPTEAAARVLPMMVQTRDRDLATVDPRHVLRLRYHDLVSEPVAAVDRLTEFLKIEPTREQLQAAIKFVDPQLRNFQTTEETIRA